jgi:hypothetical protein
MRTPHAWLVALALLLAGCAGTQSETAWTKHGVTEEQRQRDRSECLTQARQVVPGPDGPRMRLDYPRYERCMAERGYTMAPAK